MRNEVTANSTSFRAVEVHVFAVVVAFTTLGPRVTVNVKVVAVDALNRKFSKIYFWKKLKLVVMRRTALFARFATADGHPGRVAFTFAHRRPDSAVLVRIFALSCKSIDL